MMQTMDQIVGDMLLANQKLADRSNPDNMLEMSQMIVRQKEREMADLALAKLIVYFSTALASATAGPMSYEHRTGMISGTMMQVVMIWEDANKRFEEQLKTRSA